MNCHIPECGYPKGECAGTCGSHRKVKPYPNTVNDLPVIDFDAEEYKREGIQTLIRYAAFVAFLLAVVFTHSVIAGFVPAK